MRTIIILLFTVTCVLSCSKKNDGGNAGGSPIDDMDLAKRAAAHIQRVTNPVIAGLAGKDRTVRDSLINGPGSGSVLLNAVANVTNSGSATSTLSVKTVSAYLQFNSYKDTAVTLNGSLQYYYYDYYRMACSTSGCASSSKTSRSYDSKYVPAGGGTEVEHPIAISFSYNGRSIKDTIGVLVSMSTERRSTYVTVTTAAGKTFKYSY
ncbi:hypothetical protein Q4E93_19295 [Flavitalea sp. BT771]|uniref:hypothetical protein n=1 Tax=Flavitalea sp. BT771 TaxID=3063329 RepID=UPI0026E484BE|nr:hypothetical protein [Flavitalea sp. BT771]MDO6432761.1 hypothetical protein [Flavitalea sp. BT771]MDV6221963.1 hypothetical protein [Flavitalea sp. BT771]